MSLPVSHFATPSSGRRQGLNPLLFSSFIALTKSLLSCTQSVKIESARTIRDDTTAAKSERGRRLPHCPSYSLNGEKRRWDLARIGEENQQLLKRLEGKKSELAQEHWQQNWHKEQLLRQSIARYPWGTGSCRVNKALV